MDFSCFFIYSVSKKVKRHSVLYFALKKKKIKYEEKYHCEALNCTLGLIVLFDLSMRSAVCKIKRSERKYMNGTGSAIMKTDVPH